MAEGTRGTVRVTDAVIAFCIALIPSLCLSLCIFHVSHEVHEGGRADDDDDDDVNGGCCDDQR